MRLTTRCGVVAAVAVLAACLSPRAQASCGAAFCSVNSSWNVQAPWSGEGTRVDLRAEYIDQDQPRRGNRRIDIGEIRHHHDEVETINRNLVLSVDHSFNEHWGLSVSAPLVDRSHDHIHNHRGAKVPESWDFTDPGDLRVVGRYQINGENPASAFGLLYGVKLPTGRFHVRNSAGSEAERTLQPGTGTTDAILGAYVHDTLPIPDSSWFGQIQVQRAIDEREEFRPGWQAGLDLGYGYQAAEKLALLLQANLTYKGKDSGEQSEREDSGGYTVAFSPGASYAVGERTSVYGFVQVPVYQYVHGVQLTNDWSAVLGVSTRF